MSLIKARSSTLHKPRQFFMPLQRFVQKHGPPQADQVVTKTWNGQKMEGVLVTKQEDADMWEVDEAESQSVTVKQASAWAWAMGPYYLLLIIKQ